MATPGKSKNFNTTLNKDSDSIWDKIGTIGRKKKIKQIKEIETEGQIAIESPGSPAHVVIPPEEYELEEGEERSMISPKSYNDPNVKNLINILIDWLNDELSSERIIVKDIGEDLFDGQVLQKLIEKLEHTKLDCPEVTLSEEGQKQKLNYVITFINQKWSVESIHSKNIVSILYLVVSLVRFYRSPIRLPDNVEVEVVIVQKKDGLLNHRIVHECITRNYQDCGMRCETDAFDTMFDSAPDKLQTLLAFVNNHLKKLSLKVDNVDNQFHDGVYLIILMGLLEGYFVPLYSFYLAPKDFDQKLHNVKLAFDLMQEAKLPQPKARPEGNYYNC